MQMTELHTKNNQAGFSLMELLVAMVIMLVIMAAAFGLMSGSIITANTNYEMTTANQGLRNSQEFLMRDILVAGDGLKGVANIWLPTTFVKTYLSARPVSELDPADSGFIIIGSVLSDHNVPAGVIIPGTNPAITVRERTDRITMLTADPDFISIDLPIGSTNLNTGQITIPASRLGDFTVGEVYFVTGSGSGVFGQITAIDKASNSIFWADGDALGLNRTGSTGPLATGTNNAKSPATLKRMKIVHYYMDDEEKLVRRVFGVREEQFIDSVIAEHLATLRFRYILKPQTADVIFQQPKDQIDLSEAVSVRMIEPAVSVKTAYPLQDHIRHQVDGITQISVRNVQFLEAPLPVDSVGNTELPPIGPVPKITPKPTPTPVPPPTPVPTPKPSPTPTPIPGPSPKPTVTPVPKPTVTPVPTPVPTPTPIPIGQGDG